MTDDLNDRLRRPWYDGINAEGPELMNTLKEAADRIEELETALQEIVEWRDAVLAIRRDAQVKVLFDSIAVVGDNDD